MAVEPAVVVDYGWGRKGVLGVEGWAELRREHFVRGVSIKELARRTGMSRNMIRAALRSARPPSYERALAGSKLDPLKDEILRLLKHDPRLTGQRIRELIVPLGFDGGKTIVDDYLREVRPLFDPPRTYQRTIYRPGEIGQFDVWEPKAEVPGRPWPDTQGVGRDRVLGLPAPALAR
jgi:transposase